MAKFQIQTASSTVNWTGKKVLGLHTGTINLSNGYLEVSEGNITDAEIEIDMTTIVVTDIEDKKTLKDFHDHLLNDDFFSVDKFKRARFKMTHSEGQGNNQYRISGNLTIKDITHPVSFLAKIEIFADFLHSLGEIVIDRTFYNIRYGSGKFIDNLGDKLIYDDFVMQFKLVGQVQVLAEV